MAQALPDQARRRRVERNGIIPEKSMGPCPASYRASGLLGNNLNAMREAMPCVADRVIV